jgi:LysM repeat protein
MSVCRLFTTAAALVMFVLGVGCRDRANDPIPAETDDPFFVQGRQLQRMGRNPEALTAFLKVIEKRGERAAAESHFEAGQIYLNHTKDPVEAYHHFRKYLELQPNSKQADLVRGMVKAALREFARTVPGRPLEDQSMRLQADEEAAKLRREVDELRAELAVVRGGAGVPVNRQTHVIKLPPETRTNTAPVPTTPVATPTVAEPQVTRTPVRTPAASIQQPPATSPIQPAGPSRTAPPVATRLPTATPTRSTPTTPSRPTPTSTQSSRTHTVVAKDTLFNISKKYGVRIEDLAAANGISTSSAVKLGTVLRIPPGNGAR